MNETYTSLDPSNVSHVMEPPSHAYGTYGSCRSRGRPERAHRSLENRTDRGFPQLPQAIITLAIEMRSAARQEL
jgi:hypothetical protein